MPQRRKTVKMQRVVSNNSSGRSRGSTHPPQFNATPIVRQRFRYMATAALNAVTITSAELMQRIVMAATATTSFSILTAFRVRSVELWGPPPQALSPVTVSVEFTNTTASTSFGTRRSMHSDTSVGATRVAHVSAKPLPGTSAAAWQNTQGSNTNTTGASFVLSGPSNTIVDVVLDFTIPNSEAPYAGPAGTALVPGTLYYPALDGGIAGLLQPVSATPLV